MDLTDLTVTPSIIVSIAITSVVIHTFSGWNILVSGIVAVNPGAIIGMIAGLLLAAVLDSVLSLFKSER